MQQTLEVCEPFSAAKRKSKLQEISLSLVFTLQEAKLLLFLFQEGKK